MKCQALFPLKNDFKKFEVLSAAVVTGALMVKIFKPVQQSPMF